MHSLVGAECSVNAASALAANLKEAFTFHCVTSSFVLRRRRGGAGSRWSLQMPAERGKHNVDKPHDRIGPL